METNFDSHQLKSVITEAAALGATIAITHAGKLKPYLKKSEAFRKYGRSNIERWINEGHLTARKDGSHSASWRIDRIELEILIRSNNICKIIGNVIG